MQDEPLNEVLFFGFDHARQAVAEWAEDYNTPWRHSPFDYKTPAAFAAYLTATGLHAPHSDGSACRPIVPLTRKGIVMPRTKSPIGETSVAGQGG